MDSVKISICKLTLVFFLFFASFTSPALADESRSFITIVNPVRISAYTRDPVANIVAEYAQIKKREFPATWLLTFDVFERRNLVSQFSSMDSNQELGIFLEVTPEFARSAGVAYNMTNGWHRATSLFLSGYSQVDRVKLIDTVFSKFKKTFGYFPKSVGAWWVDAYSLSYMQKKYGVTGVLGVSDQYDLDGYQVWGTSWSIPYYPNLINAAIPASTLANKLDVVTFRWAARDPLNGYMSPTKNQASLYSTQDYSGLGLGDDYFRKLVNLYLAESDFNQFSQITIGLEADYSPDTYNGQYSRWLDVVSEQEERGVNISSMREFSEWYRSKFKFSPPHVIETDDLLGKPEIVLWFQNNLYRVGVLYNKQTYNAEIIDFRIYPDNFIEPFYSSPNKQYNLSINLPFVIDSVIDKNSFWKFNAGHLQSISNNLGDLSLNFEKGSIVFENNSISVLGILIPHNVRNSKQLSLRNKTSGVDIYPKTKYFVGPDGIVLSDYSIRVPFAVQYRIERYRIPVALITVLVFAFAWGFVKKHKICKKYYLIILSIGVLAVGMYFFVQSNVKYFISQTEADGLSVLQRLPAGKVLVYDKDCLRCTFVTPLKPAAVSGKKSYISKLSKQNTISDFTFVTAPTSQMARQILKDRGIKYVYLTKYESYIESLPYIPRDLGLKRVYENANVDIWKVE